MLILTFKKPFLVSRVKKSKRNINTGRSCYDTNIVFYGFFDTLLFFEKVSKYLSVFLLFMVANSLHFNKFTPIVPVSFENVSKNSQDSITNNEIPHNLFQKSRSGKS